MQVKLWTDYKNLTLVSGNDYKNLTLVSGTDYKNLTLVSGTDYKNLTLVSGTDRHICLEGYCLTSQGSAVSTILKRHI